MSVRFGDIGERIVRTDRGIFSIDRTRHIQGNTIAEDEIFCRDIAIGCQRCKSLRVESAAILGIGDR